jgi:hypothetical protein
VPDLNSPLHRLEGGHAKAADTNGAHKTRPDRTYAQPVAPATCRQKYCSQTVRERCARKDGSCLGTRRGKGLRVSLPLALRQRLATQMSGNDEAIGFDAQAIARHRR